MHARLKTTFVLLVVLTSARGQTIDAVLAEAAAAVKAGQSDVAAKAFGRAAAIAHKANDLLAEQRVAEALWPFLDGPRDRADALAGVLPDLDPKRAGAFVSAGTIASELILVATSTGDMKHVKAASKVLASQAALQKCGKAARAFSVYAKALETVAATKGTDVSDALAKVVAEAIAQGWTDVAIHAGTELAAQLHTSGKSSEAKLALAVVAAIIKPDTDPDLVQVWRGIVNSRLKDAAPDTLAPFTDAMKPFARISVSAAGGVGGAGGTPGGQSKLGKAWNNLPAIQSFVTVKRLDDGFEITEAFDSALKAKQPLENGLRYRGEGGVTLSFRGRGVALRMLDLEGTRGQPGATSGLPPGVPLYRLAKGETWSLSRQGVVAISG
jgi:hypothetical protein